jgi:hypothetical protein
MKYLYFKMKYLLPKNKIAFTLKQNTYIYVLEESNYQYMGTIIICSSKYNLKLFNKYVGYKLFNHTQFPYLSLYRLVSHWNLISLVGRF